MTTLTVQELDAQLARLLEAVEHGDEVVIERQGVPVARLVPEQAPTRREIRFGFLADKITIVDPNWDAPLSDDELREMFGDDYVDG